MSLENLMVKDRRGIGLKVFWSVLLAASLVLSACRMPAPATPTRADPNALFTSAARTAEARRVLRDQYTDTPTTTSSAAPSSSPEPGTSTPTGPVLATVDLATVDTTTSPVADKAAFIMDVTVPDGEAHGPNRPFVKTWRLQNDGQTTWSTAYSMVFVSGSLMSAQADIAMPQEVIPGDTVDISVELVAPAEPGIYQSLWKLRNDKGQAFGVGETGSDPIWAIIGVVAGAGEGTPTAAPSSGEVVTALDLSVDPPTFSGACPRTFVFTVEFTLSKGDTVTYGLEAGNDQGIEMKLPPPMTRTLEAGTHTTEYQLVFSSDLNGWVRVSFSAPELVVSRQVNFTLSCL
jgi:hypothetical protein